ncbi:MAG: sugar phosphate isomerase/epimerase [candidate division WS1 bacterium]|nr:sugar phosphate isomerase/epimerase [candidate division WS1 bacterium]
MARDVKFELGINGAFLTRRWERPGNWMRLTREIGFRNQEFCGDVIDPFFSGDREFQLETCRQVRSEAERYGVHITDIYTGVATHRFHGLSHSHPSPRQRMKEWILDCCDLALEMGTDRIGGHWDAISVEVMEDDDAYRAAVGRVQSIFRELSRAAAQKGIAAIYNEQMYIPSEIPWTLRQAEEFLLAVNRDNDGCPVLLTIDVGHQAGMHYGLEGDDLDYIEWCRRFGAVSEIVHLQQTTPDASHHWPFTAEYNERGHVDVPAILDALEQSHREYELSPLAEVLPPVERTWLIAEIIPGSTKTETALLDELKMSAEYLHQFVPEDGLTLSV